jgi:hypothetical protein
LRAAVVICLLWCLAPAVVLAADTSPVVAHADSLAGYWGPRPARADSNTALPRAPEPAGWQKALLVPYTVVGWPLSALDAGAKATLVGLDRLGALAFTEQVVGGVRDPLGNYWMPNIDYDDAQGWQFGVVGQRPEFPLRGMRTRVEAGVSLRDATSWSAGTLAPLGPRSWLEFGGGSLLLVRTDYYGRGIGTVEDDRSYYQRDSDWIGAAVRRRVRGPVETMAVVHYSCQDARPTRYDRDEALEVIHGDDPPYGWEMASSGVTGALQLVLDTTTETGRPDEGGRVVMMAEHFTPTDNTDSRFWTVGASAELFTGLGRPQRNLALKAWWLRQYDTGRDPIPFTRLLRNRDPYHLRAYGSTRFHASGMVGVAAEYRWPVWTLNRPGQTGLDAYLLADVGQPYDHASELAVEHLFWSAGFGLRVVVGKGRYKVRAEVAVGDEGTQWRLASSQIFQFLKAGFHAGSEPVPMLR